MKTIHKRAVKPPPVTGTYSTIVADPPWPYLDTWARGAAANHYPTMSHGELVALAPEYIPAAPNSHLYLWVPYPMIQQGLDLCGIWGFEYKVLLTWVKPHFGNGHYFRSASERIIFGVRGKLPINARNIPTWFQAPRTKHSRKPDLFYDIVERASPGHYLELFARERRPGWDAWGNEVDGIADEDVNERVVLEEGTQS